MLVTYCTYVYWVVNLIFSSGQVYLEDERMWLAGLKVRMCPCFQNVVRTALCKIIGCLLLFLILEAVRLDKKL